jgi:hypothetical protein
MNYPKQPENEQQVKAALNRLAEIVAAERLTPAYAAGFRAGIEAAARVCEDELRDSEYQWLHDRIAAAIRALIAPDREGAG